MQSASRTFLFAAISTSLVGPGCKRAASHAVATRPTTAAVIKVTARPAATRPTLLFKFSPHSLDLILAGTKTATTRPGDRAIAVGPAVIGDDNRTVPVTVLSVTHKAVADLTDDDARADATGSAGVMKATLAKNYENVTPGEMVTVVVFRR